MNKSPGIFNYFVSVLILLFFYQGCTSSRDSSNENYQGTISKQGKNEVLVMGMIHGKHRKSELYGIGYLKNIIRTIEPDLILTEIPPDRFEAAMQEFQEIDTITEERVSRFPEYVDAIFPLTKEMDFQIIPTAGWTKEMADTRSEHMKQISQDELRKTEWEEYTKASIRSDSALKAGGEKDDPYWIHTDGYDAAVEEWAETYNRLFNDELGAGGWDNINAAHYSHIEAALDQHKNEGKMVLITYGAGHKGWFLRKLRKRKDIKLIDMKPFLDKSLKQK